MKFASQFCLVVLSLSLVACGNKETESKGWSSGSGDGAKTETTTNANASVVTKTTDEKTYTNDFFKMTVQKPEGWYAQTEEEATAGQKQGEKMLAGNDKNLQAAVEASKDSTKQLFGFFEVPRGTPGKLNPNVLAAAENLKASPGIKSGCDYIAATKELIKRSQVNYEFEDKCEKKMINGTEFGMTNAQLKIGDQVIKQRYYSTIRNQHAIAVIETFFDAESEAKVSKVTQSVKLN